MTEPLTRDHGASTAPAVTHRIRRTAALIGIAGAVVMSASTVVMYATGADIFTAVADRETADYLLDADDHRTALYLHLDMWVIGAVAMSLALVMIAATSRLSASALVARFAATAAAGAVIVFFPMMTGLIYGLGDRPEYAPVAEALGRTAIHADDIATLMILGVAGFATALAGRGDWASDGLVRFAAVPLFAGVLSLLPLGTAAAVASIVLVLSGLALVVAVGIVNLRPVPGGAR